MHAITDIGLLESGRIVDTVAGDSDDSAEALAAFDDDELLLGRGAGEHDLGVVAEDVVQLVASELAQFSTVDDGRLGQALVHLLDGDVEPGCDVVHRLVAFGDDADRLGDGLGRDGVITGHHDD